MASNTNKRSYLLTWIGILLSLFGLIFAYVGWYSIELEGRYEKEGIKVQGTITGKNIEETWETNSETKQRTKKTSYYIKYNFAPSSGGAIDSRSSVGSDEYNKASSGDKVEIQYLQSDTSLNRIAGSSDYTFGCAFMAFGSLIILAGLCIFVFDSKKRNLMKRLSTEGTQVEGIIESVGPGNYSVNDVLHWRIEYSFKDYKGQEHKAKSSHYPPQKLQGMKAGDKGRVKYDRNNPKLSMWVWEP